jgi:phosphatidylserine decarboxylase
VGQERFLGMTWQIFLSSLVLSLILLIPLSIKWEIPKRIAIPSSLVVGILTGLIVKSIVENYHIKFWQILILQIFLIMGISASLLLWRFFRDPERVSPEDQNVILSPADGKVIYVKRIEKGAIPYSEKNGKKFSLNDFTQSDTLPPKGYLIGISMNFLNVHVNRAPIGGKVSLIRPIKGGFASLKKKEAVIQNARALTIIDNGNFKVGIVQIASRLVRNIVLYLQEGHEVHRGERIGMIRFGSQVDLILPSLPSLRIEVNPSEEVKAGISIMARILKDPISQN